jgi:hypothetical protein
MSTKSRQTIYGGPIRDADRAGRARPLRAGVHVIKLTEKREITPYKWVHPDEER